MCLYNIVLYRHIYVPIQQWTATKQYQTFKRSIDVVHRFDRLLLNAACPVSLTVTTYALPITKLIPF